MLTSKFQIIYEKVMTQINESGHMLSNVSKIKKENIKLTINNIAENIFNKLGIDESSWTAEIGSAADGGKKDESGDLDIAVNFKKIENDLNISNGQNYIFNFLKEHGFDVRKVGDLISFRFPIQGSQLKNDEYVQVDLFNSDDLEFSKWRMFSPVLKKSNEILKNDESKYKGVHRFIAITSLIKIISLALNNEINDDDKFTGPDGVIYPGKNFNHIMINSNGFFNVNKTFMSNKGKLLKNPQVIAKTMLTRNPQEILDTLFGKGKYNTEDLKSFESIWNNILSDPEFPYKEKLPQIKHLIKSSIEDIHRKDNSIEIPTELYENN